MKPVFVRPEGTEGDRRVTCYVCGCPRCAEYPLGIRQQGSGPYFPFLETHEPPDGAESPTQDGRVMSCFLCYSFLMQQWEIYERDKVPPVKRIYWLKRVDNGPYTGVEVGVQSEYASQLLGLTPDPPVPPPDIKRPGPSSSSSSSRVHPTPPIVPVTTSTIVETKRPRIMPPQAQPPTMPLPPPGIVPPLPMGLPVPQAGPQQEALDLSLDCRRGTKRQQPEPLPPPPQPQPQPPQTEGLDLSMPDKNATTEVCYVCGDHHKKGTLVDIYATEQTGSCPFFPSLTRHSRPSKSHPMEASGRVQGCRECYNHLHLQWETYEAHKMPHEERNYSLRKRNSVMQDSTAFICYKCGCEFPSSKLCLIYCKPNCEKEPYYPFILKLEPPEGASPISPQGMVQVCSLCSKTIPQLQRRPQEKSGDTVKNVSPELKNAPVEGSSSGQQQTNSPIGSSTQHNSHIMSLAITDSNLDDVACYLCHQSHHRQMMHWLPMVAEKSTSNGMYFLFLKFLPRMPANTVVEDGQVLACHLCYQHLSTQWEEYEKENVSTEHRQFSLRAMPITSHSPRLTPGSRHGSPDRMNATDASPPQSFASAGEVHIKLSENTNKASTTAGYIGQPLHTLEVVPATHDSKTPTLPVITTQHALNIAVNCFVCSFHSKPGQTYALRSKAQGTDPFFPFLAKHQSAHPEARVDASCVLVCFCCFHSLILQWQQYEKAQVDHNARLYDTYNYSCFICSLKTYRKRLYPLPVKDYPFLKEHNRPAGGMVVENGRSVVVCKDCYSSLKNQAGNSSGLHSFMSKRSEETARAVPSNTIPKMATVGSSVSSPEPPSVGSTPSCFAPLQLKIGIARQGGNQHSNLSKRHTVAPREGSNSGDATSYGFSGHSFNSVDQSAKTISSERKFLPTISRGHVSSIKTPVNHLQPLETEKSRSSKTGLISIVTHSSTSTSPRIPTSTCSPHMVSPPHGLQAKCS